MWVALPVIGQGWFRVRSLVRSKRKIDVGRPPRGSSGKATVPGTKSRLRPRRCKAPGLPVRLMIRTCRWPDARHRVRQGDWHRLPRAPG